MGRLFDNALSQYMEKDVAPVAAAPFTIMVWVYTDDVTSLQTFLQLGDKDVAAEKWELQMAGTVAGDPFRARLESGGGGQIMNTSTGFTVNTWHHCTLREAANNDHEIYIDAGSIDTSVTVVAPVGADRISIGREGDSSPGLYFSGRLAEASIFNVALDLDEITANFRGVPASRIRPSALRGYWSIWGDHSPEIDLSGQGNSLTLFNGPVKANHAPVSRYWLPPWAATVPLIAGAVPPPPPAEPLLKYGQVGRQSGLEFGQIIRKTEDPPYGAPILDPDKPPFGQVIERLTGPGYGQKRRR